MSKKNKSITLDIACMDDGEIYIGERKKGHKDFRKGRMFNVTKEVLDAVVNYMAIHIKDEDVPEYILDVSDKESNQKAVLTFRIVNNREDVMFK